MTDDLGYITGNLTGINRTD